MARIPQLKLLLRVLLLLTLVMEPCAFTTRRPFRSPLDSRHQLGRFVSTVDEDSGGPKPMLSNLAEEDLPMLKMPQEELKPKNNSRLPWMFILLAFMQSQFFGNSSVPGADGMTFSTISASLLRSNRASRQVLVQQFLFGAVIMWQVGSNSGHLIKWTQAATASFSWWYMGCLTAFPVYTKALTTGLIGLLGDFGAQLLEERIRSRREGSKFQISGRFDRRRSLANVADGVLVTGPLLHFAYNFLETLIPVQGAATGLTASLAAITQVLIDDFILDAFFVGIMFVTTGLGEGYKLRDIAKQFRKDYIGAIRTSWATSIFLMPLEFMLFRFLPLSLRVLGMNMIDIAWEGMVSFLVHRRRKKNALDHRVNEMRNVSSTEYNPMPAH